ncbi:imidazole glycerol phosphate synthase subunit HisH [Campylobacter gracilis]|uniref:Imidazole glycerol phosphate synthase subunit HisH n=1 Tax=Campylobacter gracilis RM3268 TaxID=553220 RepID=C8PLJ7_9BACT|nr:imidazole glycerol phosphate synthase subunit HisH [Campylobacter gracilis]AKT92919.1 imidazole glycerol phosphate synthase HisFH, HisH subunit [Campylobacter gracilis]EEV16309.1 imidazole glycerol phosphate synthase, glutamine amidotransferase subunit [Campylobacter gracilis RM3268]UEB44912.1 imidazole glycerol phosphate synthase subunit HisH [Campylobacter gracilis]SUW78755.1 imidazole glycerol phosphate synthase, glutamine amidotransferase subunit [Campylobacter gracilis]
MIGIVDYGAGNIQSVMNALSFCGAKFTLARSGEELLSCDKALLPGVGAFGEAMDRLRASGMDAAIKEFVASGRYFLGICLGMQLLFEQSEEFGARSGLGILPGRVVKFDKTKFNNREAESGSEDMKFRSDGVEPSEHGGQNFTCVESLKIPHVGWNSAHFIKHSPINVGLGEFEYLYFVHSYHVLCEREITLASTFYGYEFASAIWRENVFAFQPHPEKSHDAGIKIIKNFTEL